MSTNSRFKQVSKKRVNVRFLTVVDGSYKYGKQKVETAAYGIGSKLE